MRFRFRRRIQVFPGVKINLGKKGASVSVGPRGAKITVGPKGVTSTLGLPGTGMSASNYHSWEAQPRGGAATVPEEIKHIAEERAPYWEFLLLQKGLRERVEEMNTAWTRATSEPLDVEGYCDWGISHMNELTSLLNALKTVLESDLADAMGPPGLPGDPVKILSLIESVSALLGRIIIWEQVVLVFAEHPIFGRLAGKLSGMSRPFIDTINDFKQQLDHQIRNVGATQHINIDVKMPSVPFVDAHAAALETFAKEAAEEGTEGDFFQMDFRVKRGDELLGRFSRRTVLENLNAGLFRADDLYWSEKRLAWRSVRALETEGDLNFPDSPVESADG